jgi:hypothetical protein
MGPASEIAKSWDDAIIASGSVFSVLNDWLSGKACDFINQFLHEDGF